MACSPKAGRQAGPLCAATRGAKGHFQLWAKCCSLGKQLLPFSGHSRGGGITLIVKYQASIDWFSSFSALIDRFRHFKRLKAKERRPHSPEEQSASTCACGNCFSYLFSQKQVASN